MAPNNFLLKSGRMPKLQRTPKPTIDRIPTSPAGQQLFWLRPPRRPDRADDASHDVEHRLPWPRVPFNRPHLPDDAAAKQGRPFSKLSLPLASDAIFLACGLRLVRPLGGLPDLNELHPSRR